MKSYFLVCAYSVGVDCGREGTGGGPIWSFELICTKTINGKQKQSRHCLHVSRTVRFPSAAARFARSLCIHCLQFQCRLSARGQHTASWISRQNSSAQNSKSLIKIYICSTRANIFLVWLTPPVLGAPAKLMHFSKWYKYKRTQQSKHLHSFCLKITRHIVISALQPGCLRKRWGSASIASQLYAANRMSLRIRKHLPAPKMQKVHNVIEDACLLSSLSTQLKL